MVGVDREGRLFQKSLRYGFSQISFPFSLIKLDGNLGRKILTIPHQGVAEITILVSPANRQSFIGKIQFACLIPFSSGKIFYFSRIGELQLKIKG